MTQRIEMICAGATLQISDAVQRLYIVGQLHGEPDALREIDRAILSDIANHAKDDVIVLHAGGYIDKGREISELLSSLEDRKRVGTAAVAYLLGAHEWLMLRSLSGDKRSALQWLLSGAEASLEQWRVAPDDWTATAASVIPKHHLAFLRELPTFVRVGCVTFVCSTFLNGPDRPFGLFASQRDGSAPSQSSTTARIAIGNHVNRALQNATDPWIVRERRHFRHVSFEVLDRRQRELEPGNGSEQALVQDASTRN